MHVCAHAHGHMHACVNMGLRALFNGIKMLLNIRTLKLHEKLNQPISDLQLLLRVPWRAGGEAVCYALWC